MAFVWIYRGLWPERDRLREMPDNDAKQAVEEGWAQRIEGLEGREIKGFINEPHEEADAYYARITGRSKGPAKPPPEEVAPPAAPSGGVYGTREMRATTGRKPGRPKKDD